MAIEISGQQLKSKTYEPTLDKPLGADWAKRVREMRKDPTIALARSMFIAPVLGSSWSYESTPDAPEGAVDFIAEVFERHRLALLQSTMISWLDFGWAPFEKVFAIENNNYVFTKLKPLLQDITEILIEVKTGTFAGFKQDNGEGPVLIPQDKSLCLSHEVEGSYLYGRAIMENVSDVYSRYYTLAESNDRYDARIAGTHWVIKYPIGTTTYNGVENVDNFDIAKDILASLESNGRVILPRNLDEIALMNETAKTSDAWQVELLSDSGASQTTYLERSKYLDVLKVRALSLPERSVLEGEHGTKAEAAEHIDFAIANLEIKHAFIAQQLNWHAVNQLLRLNWGKQYENTVYISPTPLTDASVGFLRNLYLKLMTSPAGMEAELGTINTEAIKDKLQIPIEVQDNIELV